jgi:hypothetical protein
MPPASIHLARPGLSFSGFGCGSSHRILRDVMSSHFCAASISSVTSRLRLLDDRLRRPTARARRSSRSTGRAFRRRRAVVQRVREADAFGRRLRDAVEDLRRLDLPLGIVGVMSTTCTYGARTSPRAATFGHGRSADRSSAGAGKRFQRPACCPPAPSPRVVRIRLDAAPVGDVLQLSATFDSCDSETGIR